MKDALSKDLVICVDDRTNEITTYKQDDVEKIYNDIYDEYDNNDE